MVPVGTTPGLERRLKSAIGDKMLESWKLGLKYSDAIFNERLRKMQEYHIPPECLHGRMIDLGANIGCFTEAYGSHFDEVYCFEPCYENYLELLKRVGDKPNVVCFPVGFGAENEFTYLNMHKNGDNGSLSIQVHDDWWTGMATTMLMLKPSILIPILHSAQLLKVDVEGAEHEIFMNLFTLGDTLERSIDCLVIELHAQWPVEAEELTAMLKRRFDVYHHAKLDHDIYTFTNKRLELKNE